MRRAWLRSDVARFVIPIALSSRLAVLAIAVATALGGHYFVGRPSVSPNPLWNAVARWDAVWYLNIATSGYAWQPADARDQQNVVFFPAYPVAMRAAGTALDAALAASGHARWLGGSTATHWLVAGCLVSIAAFTWGLALVYRLARSDLDADRAKWAVLLLAYFPFAVFFSVPYTESLFLLAIAGAFLAARDGRIGPTGLWGVVAGLTRPTGVLVALPLAMMAWLHGRRHRGAVTPRERRAGLVAVAACGPVVGLGLYMAFLAVTFGEPFAWVTGQAGWWHSDSSVPFLVERWRAVARFGVAGYVREMPAAALGTVVVLAAVALLPRVWRLSPAYAVLVVVTLAPAVAIDSPSIGRFAAPLFPMFLAVAALLRPNTPNWLLPLIFGAGQLWGAWLFFRWESFY